MDDRRVADYFVVAGLPDNPEPLDEFSCDGANLKPTHNQAPITDVAVIFRSLGELPPPGFVIIETTPSGFPADLNHGSLRSPNVYLAYRRGRDKSPLVDIGVLYEGKERVMSDSEIVLKSPSGKPANVNNSGSCTFVTYRRALETAPCNELVVTDICVILNNKGESPPHAFCMIPKNLNKGMVGSDVYLCYKKSMNRATSICYKPAILDRFPLCDHSNFPLPPSVPLFCLPMGATVECWPVKAQCPHPVFSTFILTVSHTVEKVYGAAVTFYEYFPKDNLTDEQRKKLKLNDVSNQFPTTIGTNKCICILSHWPFFDTFQKFLMYLHHMSHTGPHPLPIERYISHFMTEVPFPSPQRPRILIQLHANDRIALAQPEDSPLPLSGASFKQLLMTLGPENCMMALLFALTEQKILIHSLRPDVLTSIAEAVSMMIFPFHWQCPYIPLCPLGLSDVLSAPMPFIVGVDSRYFDLYDPPCDVSCVDLDTNTFSVSDDKKYVNIKLLPKKPARILRSTLQNLLEKLHQHQIAYNNARFHSSNEITVDLSPIDKDFKLRKRERMIELEIQEAFLRFMASILKGFRSFLRPITKAPTVGATDCNSLFDMQGFLKSRDKAYHRFYSMLMKTQMFTRFIEERSFVSDKDASLAFFDECTEKVDNGDVHEPRLLELDESHQSERTMLVTPPEPVGLPADVSYSYNGFKNLNHLLFHQKQLKTILSSISKSSPAPGSPLAKRTKQEIRTAQQVAKKHSRNPVHWSRCLLSYCYSLWFIHLPSYVKISQSKAKSLRTAYDILLKMQRSQHHPYDEVCYRVLMQLCGQYSQPVLAVKLLFEMKRNGVQPNAITYGYYNKAVLESKWPSANTNSYLLWKKLRNVIIGVALFKSGVVRRPLSTCSESDLDKVSRGSTESGQIDTNSSKTIGQGEVKADDVGSTGGHSDIGYNSMNADETQKSSSSISTSSQFTTADSENSASAEQPIGSTTNVQRRKSALKESGNGEKGTQRSLKFDEVDFTESNKFRSRVGSIVRNSVSNIAGLNSINPINGDTSVDSSAGLLITCQSVFGDGSFEVNGVGLHSGPNQRKRHSSASDFGHQTNFKFKSRHRSGPDPDLTLSPPKSGSDEEQNRQILHCESFASDAKIISQLNASNSSNKSDSTQDVSDINEINKLNSSVLEKTERNNSEINPVAHSTPTSMSLPLNEYSGRKSPSIPICRSNGCSSPQRIPVTNNDPLGLFSENVDTVSSDSSRTVTSTKNSPIMSTSISSGSGVSKDSWFDMELIKNNLNARTSNASRGDGQSNHSAKVTRSATFCHSPQHLMSSSSDDKEAKKSLQRSSTLPTSSPSQTQKSLSSSNLSSAGFSNFASSFKFPFSPSQKRSEFLIGSLNSLKSVANSMASKLSEIKEAVSSNNTPTKGTSFLRPYEMERCLLMYEEEPDSITEVPHRNSVDYLSHSLSDDISQDEFDSNLKENSKGTIHHAGSAPVIQDLLQLPMLENQTMMRSASSQNLNPVNLALEISITSCSKCYTCASLLYDEEIMLGWTAEDSNLNTQCQFCKSKLVPFLSILIKDHRIPSDGKSLSSAQSIDSMHSVQSFSSIPMMKDINDSQTDIGRSIDSDNFLLLEGSPESLSLSSAISSPLDSPLKKLSSTDNSEGVDYITPPADMYSDTPIYIKQHSPLPIVENCQEGQENTKPNLQGILLLNEEQETMESLPSSKTSSMANGINQTKNDSQREKAQLPVILDPISVPYLSPIVLRKEMENVLEHEGDNCLISPEFVDEHPIIYWNIMWFFQRIDVPSHLPGLCLQAKSINKEREIPETWCSADSRNVLVRCLWDNPKLHGEVGPPMYILWTHNISQSSLIHALVTEQRTASRGLMQQIISGVQCNNLLNPIKLILHEMQKRRTTKKAIVHHSIYRDLLFLVITVLGRENINIQSFDQEYRRAFEQLSPRQRQILRKCDYPPSYGIMLCRQLFHELEL